MTEGRGERGKNRRTRKKGRPGKKPRKAESPRRRRKPARRRGRRRIMLKAMIHPLRRRLLLRMNEANAPRSPTQLAKEFDLPLGLVIYHTAVLRKCGAVEVATDGDR